MLRSTLIGAGAALLCATSFAQRQVDPSDIYPVTAPIQDAGVFNLSTHRWMTPSRVDQLRGTTFTIYNNTCTWTGANYYTQTNHCYEFFDEGRIPGGVGGPAPVGASPDNLISFFEIGYCTNFATGTVDVKVGLYNNLNGGCLNGQAVTPTPGGLAAAATGYFDLGAASGFPLPGDATPGGTGINCWRVGFAVANAGVCLLSDGDGIFDNNINLDQFSWSWEMENVQTGPGPNPAPSGVLIRGEPTHPSSGGPGSCTYNIPCGTDFFSAQPCGTGLDEEDLFWINIDGDNNGDTINTGVTCPGAPPGGGCYFFFGYPVNQESSFFLVLGSTGSCAGCTGSPQAYCTAGTTTSGCNASIGLSSGTPSATNAGPAVVTVTNVEGNKSGLIFYGLASQALPWGTGTSFLCVKAPTQRTAAQTTGGASGTCAGTLAVDINASIAASGGSVTGVPAFAGMNVFLQGWFRDPPAPKTTHLSNGLQITLCP